MTRGPSLIRFSSLEPSWAVKRAREPGFLRWLVSWMGGPPGTVNFNPAQAAQSAVAAAGFMAMPRGNRQAGLHIHSVAEIYVILKGEIEGYDHTGTPHRAGPSDCIYIPAGVPHGVETVGAEDLHLIWVHDAIERLGVSVYLEDDAAAESEQHIQIVSSKDRFQPAGGRVETAAYVGHGGIPNPAIQLGVTRLLSGGVAAIEPTAAARLYIGIAGAVSVRCGDAAQTLAYLDGLHLPAGTGATVWNPGDAPADLLCLVEGRDAL